MAPNTSTPARNTGGLSFGKYQQPMNPSQRTTVYQGVNQAASANDIYLKQSKWAYMGTKVDPKTGRKQNTFMDVNAADTSFMFLDQAGKDALRKQMDAYYGKGVWQESWVRKLYARNVQASAYAYANGGQLVTPLDLTLGGIGAGEAGGSGGGSGGGGGGGGYSGPTTTVQTARSVNLTDPMSARKLVDDALGTYLGRRATEQEQDAFLAALNKREKKNPTVTQQVTTSTPGIGTSTVDTSSATSGGFNPSVFADAYARGQQGSGEYQAATTYLDTFINALKARV